MSENYFHLGASADAETDPEREALQDLYDYADKRLNGPVWRFRDQPIAKRVAAILAREQ